jgi:hypothetical protein
VLCTRIPDRYLHNTLPTLFALPLAPMHPLFRISDECCPWQRLSRDNTRGWGGVANDIRDESRLGPRNDEDPLNQIFTDNLVLRVVPLRVVPT